jgi:hypothetical protein
MGGALLAALALGWALRPRPVNVETGSVGRGRVVEQLEDEGHTHVRRRWRVAAPVAGFLLEPPLRAGDAVAATDEAALELVAARLRAGDGLGEACAATGAIPDVVVEAAVKARTVPAGAQPPPAVGWRELFTQEFSFPTSPNEDVMALNHPK